MNEKTFSCDTQGILGAQEFLSSASASPKAAVVMDEIVSNIVRCSGSRDFSVGLETTDDGFVMAFADRGKAFDPTRETEIPDVTAAVADREIGGLGVFMVKKMSKSLSYRRQDGKNVLTVVM